MKVCNCKHVIKIIIKQHYHYHHRKHIIKRVFKQHYHYQHQRHYYHIIFTNFYFHFLHCVIYYFFLHESIRIRALCLSSLDPNSNNMCKIGICNSLASPNCSTCKVLFSLGATFSATLCFFCLCTGANAPLSRVTLKTVPLGIFQPVVSTPSFIHMPSSCWLE